MVYLMVVMMVYPKAEMTVYELLGVMWAAMMVAMMVYE